MKTYIKGYGSHSVKYETEEQRKAVYDFVNYAGIKITLTLIHMIGNEITTKEQFRFYCSFVGIQGYPVNCFINWLNNYNKKLD